MSEIVWSDLAAPFDESELEWRPGYVFEDRDDPCKGNALALPYIQNRAVMDRLDAVVGHENWRNEFSAAPQGGVLCTLYIRVNDEWIGKQDAAENTDFESVKGGISDSMKRAAVQWSIGRYLYNLPMVNHPVKRSDPKSKNWKFIGTPKLPMQHTKSHIDDKRETRLDTKPDEKPAQAKGNAVNRPFKTVEALVEWLKGEARNVKASVGVIDQGKASNIAQAMGKFLNENERHYLLWLAWEIESSKELNEREWLTLKAWCASPIAQVEAESKLVEAAYASAVERDLANNG